MIRRATTEDLPQIVELGTEFHAHSPYGWAPFVPEAFEAFARHIIEHGAIFLSEDGFIGGLKTPLYFNPALLMAGEMFWFARVGGRQLREAYEAWAREEGCVCATSGALADENEPAIRRNYERAGYVPMEVAFMKRLDQ